MSDGPERIRPSWLDELRAQEILETIAPVAQLFLAAGHSLYLVGGVVRDLSLGADGSVTDLDLTTDATPETTRKLLAPLAHELWTQGERFGTIGASIGAWAIEVTTHRGESYVSDSRKPDVTFGTDLRTDLSRRDFTINAMALDAIAGDLVDPFGGAADLESRILRTPLDPAISFTDDPLRMLRAARFIPRFDLSVHESILDAVAEHRDRLEIVSRERVHDELERLLALPRPHDGLVFLSSTGLLERITGPLTAAPLAVAECVGGAESSLARRAVLAAHVADPAEWLNELRYSTSNRRATQKLVDGFAVMRTGDAEAAAVRRLVATVGRDAMADLFDGAVAIGLDVEPFREQLNSLEATEDLDDLGSPLSGGDIIEILDVPPGPVVGEFTRRLAETRLDEGPLSIDQATALVREWFATGQDPNSPDR